MLHLHFPTRSIARNILGASALLCLLAIVGCVGPSKYEAYSGGIMKSGYEEMPIDGTTYRVTFYGNQVTTAEVVDRYALYRSAELTVDKGFDYFIVLDQQKSSQDFTTSRTSPGSTDVDIHHKVDPTTGQMVPVAVSTTSYRTTTTTSTSHEVTKTIRMFKGAKPAENASAYDAKSMVSVMAPYIEKPK